MNKKLTDALFTDFPKLYADKDKDCTQTLICFGFETGDGWEPLIRECSAKLEAINNRIENPDNWIRASQIKEKFGTLRFYLNSVPIEYADEADKAVDEAEEKSGVTCEMCGEPGDTYGGSWLSTVCEKHKKKT